MWSRSRRSRGSSVTHSSCASSAASRTRSSQARSRCRAPRSSRSSFARGRGVRARSGRRTRALTGASWLERARPRGSEAAGRPVAAKVAALGVGAAVVTGGAVVAPALARTASPARSPPRCARLRPRRRVPARPLAAVRCGGRPRPVAGRSGRAPATRSASPAEPATAERRRGGTRRGPAPERDRGATSRRTAGPETAAGPGGAFSSGGGSVGGRRRAPAAARAPADDAGSRGSGGDGDAHDNGGEGRVKPTVKPRQDHPQRVAGSEPVTDDGALARSGGGA